MMNVTEYGYINAYIINNRKKVLELYKYININHCYLTCVSFSCNNNIFINSESIYNIVAIWYNSDFDGWTVKRSKHNHLDRRIDYDDIADIFKTKRLYKIGFPTNIRHISRKYFSKYLEDQIRHIRSNREFTIGTSGEKIIVNLYNNRSTLYKQVELLGYRKFTVYIETHKKTVIDNYVSKWLKNY